MSISILVYLFLQKMYLFEFVDFKRVIQVTNDHPVEFNPVWRYSICLTKLVKQVVYRYLFNK